MSLVEKLLRCSDCGTTFAFSVAEQEFYAAKGYTNEPKRCASCREARKLRRSSFDGYRSRREMFPATCAGCGINTQVPFEPREGRPVYCSDCYSKIRVTR
jgi:CxxC-x17-CxxC domain-containing protein